MTAKTQSPGADSEYEQWENTTAGRVCLVFYNQLGMLQDKIIDSFRKFQITPKERKLNQERAANSELDHFQNGIFAPVRLIESADDVEQIRSNPNLVSESDMKELLTKRSAKAFQERVDGITNEHALTRMLELAHNDDNATAKQVAIIEARLREVVPAAFTEVRTVGGPGQAFQGAVTTQDLGR